MIHFFYNGGEMKRLTVSVILLFIFVLALPAASMGGGNVGADVSYFRHYNRSLSNVESQEVVIGISNDNYFDSEGIFGLGLDVGYGFAFGQLRGFDAIHLGADALFRIPMNDFMAFIFSIGIRDSIYVFNNIDTNEFGWGCGMSLAFKPADFIQLEASLGYTMPIVSSYEGVIAPNSHIVSCSIAASYLY